MNLGVRLSRWVIPILVAAGAAWIKVRAGQVDASLALACLGGWLVGMSVVLVLEGLGTLLVGWSAGPAGNRGRGDQLEWDRLRIGRRLAELEDDLTARKLESGEAEALCSELRRKKDELTGRIEDLGRELTVAEQIEAEVQRREEASS